MKPASKWQTTTTMFLTMITSMVLMAQGSPATSARTSAKSKKAAKHSTQPAITAADMQALRDALAAQQQQIQQLQQQVQQREATFQQAQQASQQQLQQAQTTAADAQAKAAAVEASANQQKVSVDKLSSALADVKTTLTNSAVSTQEEQKRVSALEGVMGRFRFNGDIRVRGESFFQSYSGCTACFDRNRARVRVRFGFDGKLNDDFVGGVALASGSLGDPTTTNETLTNFFDRKTIGLDRGYITYNPVAHKWLSLTGGKFPYPWQRTQVTGDPDINPEGFNEKLSFDLTTPYLKNVTVQGIELLFNENTTSSFLLQHDSYAVGGQVSGKLNFGPWTTTPSFMILNWRNVDAILNASAFSVAASPGEGPGCRSLGGTLTNCVFSPNGITNASTATGHFLSAFLYADLILVNQVKTGIARLPFNLLAEYENNLDAADHPLDRAGNPATLGKQSHAYLVDASLGQVKNKGDVQLGYAFLRQEQDAVLSSFAESDQRAPTNIVQHRVYGLWKLRSNTVASYTLWLGRTLNPNLQHAVLAPGWTTALGSNEPILKRMQFDLIYTF